MAHFQILEEVKKKFFKNVDGGEIQQPLWPIFFIELFVLFLSTVKCSNDDVLSQTVVVLLVDSF